MIELNAIHLDKTSAVPLYEQLRKALLEAITSGKLSAGTKLPTEEELCAQFGISRPVARQAYNMLIEDGFVERMRGRGNFVRSPVLVENYVPESVFPGIDAYDFAQRSLYDVFETVYHEKIVKSRRVLMAQTANVEFANLFGVHRGSPVLYVENVVMDQNDRPIDLSKEYLDGVTQKFEFEVVNQ